MRYFDVTKQTNIMKTILNPIQTKYKFADEDAKKSNERFRKLGNNAAKLNALKASIERNKSCK